MKTLSSSRGPLAFAALACIATTSTAQQFTTSGGPQASTDLIQVSGNGVTVPNTPSDTTVTQSVSQAITPLNSISCNNGAGGGFEHTDNWYYRVFDVSGLGGAFLPQSLDLGIEGALGGIDNTQPIRVRIYDSADLADTLIDANIVHESTVDVADQNLSILNIPVSGVVAGGSMIVEIFTPDGDVDGESFFIGSNAAGQTGPSFIRADACGLTAPADLAAIGFPGMQIVMSVNGKVDPCAPDDDFAGNDSCQSAEFITAGNYPGLRAYRQSDRSDWFNIVVGPGETATFDLGFTHAAGNIDANLFQDCSGTLLATADGTGDAESIVYTNDLSVTVSVFLEIFINDADSAECNDYTLDAGVFPPCTLDDAFAGNDTCIGGALITDGSFTDLIAFKESAGSDWFNVVVSPGDTVSFDVLFTHANGNIDANLFQDCSSTLLQAGTSTDDNEQLSFTNTFGFTVSVFLEVFVEANDVEDCNDYAINVTTGGPGDPYCAAVPNSTGSPGQISGVGSNSVAANDLTMTATDVPNGFGLFYFGPNQIQVPFNNGGFQCVGGLIQRLQPPVQASNNTVSRTVLPGAFTFMSGDQSNFQYWFRDQGVGPDQSNTTNAYSVLFAD